MRKIPCLSAGLLILAVVLMSRLPAASRPFGGPRLSAESSCSSVKGIPSGCTVITLSRGNQVFFGGNDDYIEPDSYYWVDPGGAGRYGVIWIGQPDNVQQGVNEHGLAYDSDGLPRADVNPHSERAEVTGGYTSYPIRILHECATVEEVIAWAGSHRWHSFMHDQMHFADASGDAVVISAGGDGELAFTRKPRGDGFLVSTNFNVANPSNGYSHPCWRYDRAQAALGDLVNRGTELTARDAAGVLDAVHQAAATSWTVSSLVADLPHGVVYLYYFHQFDRPVVLRVAEELANPRPPGPLSRLFPDDVRQEAARRFRRIQAEATRCRRVSMTGTAVALVCLVLLLALPFQGRRGLKFWVPAVALLGPIALVVRLVSGRCRQSGRWRIALVEAVGDVMPTVIAFTAMVALLILMPAVQSSGLAQIVLVLCLPLAVGWILIHGPLLAPATSQGRWRFLIQRLPQALVTANIGMGGIGLVAVPLAILSLRRCPIMPLTAWTVLMWWLIAVLGAAVGVLLMSLYECWALRSGFQAWSVLAACGEGEIRTPSWRTLGWWMLLSYVALFLGLAGGVVLQKALVG